MLRQNADAILF